MEGQSAKVWMAGKDEIQLRAREIVAIIRSEEPGMEHGWACSREEFLYDRDIQSDVRKIWGDAVFQELTLACRGS